MCGKPIHLVSEVSYSVRVEFLRTEGTHSVFLYTYLQLKKILHDAGKLHEIQISVSIEVLLEHSHAIINVHVVYDRFHTKLSSCKRDGSQSIKYILFGSLWKKNLSTLLYIP